MIKFLAIINITLFSFLTLIALPLLSKGDSELHANTTSAAPVNLLLNSQFKGLDYGAEAIDSKTGVGEYFNNRWRSKHIYTDTTANHQRVDDFSGGTRLTFSHSQPEFFYIRQTLPGVMQFSQKTFTMRADIESASPDLYFDFYVNARWSNNQWINVADTGQPSLTAGVHNTTFTVQDLSQYPWFNEDRNGGLEVAFRVYSPNPKTNAEVVINSISLFEGGESVAPLSDYGSELPVLSTYYETAGYSTGVVGLDPSTGQKRATFHMTSPKRLGVNYQVQHYDALGNEGKVSIYTQSGARIDNVTPDSVRKSTNGIIFVFFDSNISGIGLSWVVDSEI